jgi:hypothetical protein
MFIDERGTLMTAQEVGAIAPWAVEARPMKSTSWLKRFGYVIAALGACLSGCYFVNQPAFEESVRHQVAVGMLVATATQNLGDLKLACVGSNPVDCSRVRQRLWPSSCVERVKLSVSSTKRI